jgi:hypothetical protein
MQRQLLLAGPERGHPIRHTIRHAQAVERKRRDDSDVKLFFLSFTAFFVCFSTFLI